MNKKQKNITELICAVVSILTFLILWHIGVKGELGRLMPGDRKSVV